MGTMVGQCAPMPRLSCQIQPRSRKFLASYEKVQRNCCISNSAMRLRLESRRLNLETGRLSVRTRAQEDDKEPQEVDKVEDKSLESWTSSVQRANMVSRIFMVAFVWISLFFGISVTNNEVSGGRPGRRGPRK